MKKFEKSHYASFETNLLALQVYLFASLIGKLLTYRLHLYAVYQKYKSCLYQSTNRFLLVNNSYLKNIDS